MTKDQKKQKVKRVRETYLKNREFNLIPIRKEQERLKQLAIAELKEAQEDFYRILNFKKED